MAKAEKNEEEKSERGKETRRKKRTKRRQSKEDVRVVFLQSRGRLEELCACACGACCD